MADASNKPLIFLAFANDRDDAVGYLRNLPDEARRLREVLESAEQAGLCEVVVRSNSTAADIFKVFQSPQYRNRIAIFHYGGHANGYQLLLESASGQTAAADAGGLAAFLAQQQGLQLVFLNGCSTQQQTQGLLEANISAVISTSRAIDDQVATDFASQFYQGLAGGATIRTAYHEAEAAVKTAKGGNTRALYFGSAEDATNVLEADRWPWNLYLREGSEITDLWNLPEAVNDPLFGLPPLPKQDLPEIPYRHLNWFRREDAEIFFGRGHQIHELYDRLTAPRTAPIILFYGQSGVGKSSILDAGLIPRLERDHEVRYLRRTEGGLLDTLQLAFLPEASEVPIETAWRVKEEQVNKPLIVLLDQVEELYTRPIADLPDELDQLLRVIQSTFSDPNCRPQGKLVLGFRKEWLAELESQLVAYELPRTKVFLEPLDRRGIIEVVRGPARSERLRARYGLTVEEGLAEIIAADLLEDRGSALAPTLQILLTKMWAKATEENYEHPYFSQDLYHQLKRDGILLRDFLNQQIAAFRERYPEAVDSGLLLDIVALHTTPLGTADQCTVEQIRQQYAHLGATLPALLQQCQDLHLLTIAASTQKQSSKTTRLAHDTLAPLVRERFDESDKPGQRARRILDNRSVDWAGNQTGKPLDEADLKAVELGAAGTRALSRAEQRMVDASLVERDRRRTRRRWGMGLGFGAICGIITAALIAIIFAFETEKAKRRVEDTLAESFLGPLNAESGALTDAELTALWKLAESDNDRVRVQFVEIALRSPTLARQLLNRADVAMVADVGLDQALRDELVRLITAKLEEPELEWPIVACCVQLGHALEEKGDKFKTVSRDALLREIRKLRADAPDDLRAKGLLTSAMCGFDDDLIQKHVQELEGIFHLMYVVDSAYPIEHAQAIIDLSAKISPTETTRVIEEFFEHFRLLLDVWNDERRIEIVMEILKRLAERGGSKTSLVALCAVCDVLENPRYWSATAHAPLNEIAQLVSSQDADAAFRQIAGSMTRLSSADEHRFGKLTSMAKALFELRRRLGETDVDRLTGEYRKLLNQEVSKEARDHGLILAGIAVLHALPNGWTRQLTVELLPLIQEVARDAKFDPHVYRYAAIVAVNCSVDDWTTAADQWLSDDTWDRTFFSDRFTAACNELDFVLTSPKADNALYLITSSWKAAITDVQSEEVKAKRCCLVARMFAKLPGEYGVADQYFTQAYEFLQHTNDSSAEWRWRECCILLAPKVSATTCRQQVQRMLDGIPDNKPASSEDLRLLTLLGERISGEYPEDHPLIQRLAEHLREDSSAFVKLCAKLPGELSTDDARNYIDSLTRLMFPVPGPPYEPRQGADSLIQLSDKLSPTVRQRIGQKLQGMMPKRHDELAQFVRALAVVWGDMDPSSRNAAMDNIVTAIRNPPPPNTLNYADLGTALVELTGKLSREEAIRAFTAITIGIARTDEPRALEKFTDCLSFLTKTLDTSELVLLLRYPTCIGKARQAVLRRFEERTNTQFDGHMWKLVKSFRDLELDLKDLRRPVTLIPISP